MPNICPRHAHGNCNQENCRVYRILDNISLHGFADILKSRSKGLTILWACLVVFGIANFVGQTVFLFISFLEADAKVSVTTKADANPPELPFVTICYGGGWNQTKMYEDQIDPVLVQMSDRYSYGPKLVSPFDLNAAVEVNEWTAMKDNNITSLKEFHRRYAYSCGSLIGFILNPTMSDDIHYFCKNATFTFHLQYFYCYSGPLGQQLFPGAQAGAIIHLNNPASSESQQWKDAMSFGIQFSEHLFPNTPDVLYAPLGEIVSIGLEKKYYKRARQASLVKPKLRCLEAYNRSQACELDCYFQHYMREYKCEAVTHAPAVMKSTTGLEFCPIFLIDHGGAEHDLQLATCWKECLPNCNEIRYKATLSSQPQPSGQAKLRTHVTVYVGYSTWQFDLISESDGYPIPDLISNIGGQLGIWLGGSFLALIQVITLCTCGYGRGKVSDRSFANK